MVREERALDVGPWVRDGGPYPTYQVDVNPSILPNPTRTAKVKRKGLLGYGYEQCKVPTIPSLSQRNKGTYGPWRFRFLAGYAQALTSRRPDSPWTHHTTG